MTGNAELQTSASMKNVLRSHSLGMGTLGTDFTGSSKLFPSGLLAFGNLSFWPCYLHGQEYSWDQEMQGPPWA